MKGLTVKSLFGFDYRNNDTKDIFRQNPEFQESNRLTSSQCRAPIQFNGTGLTLLILQEHSEIITLISWSVLKLSQAPIII